MTGATFYNEFAPGAAQWIRNLITAGVVPEGEVDERSITEICPDDLAGVRRAHFYAGICGWEIALQEAGWPKERPVWSMSLPCQPFSSAGQQKGTADDRHLWPETFRLIAAARPPHIFGEQVGVRKVTGKLFTPKAFERLKPEDRRAAEEADSEAWFRHVQTDLEGVGYIVGHCVFPACSVGAPHLRQRLYWYARYVANNETHRQGPLDREPGTGTRQEKQAGGHGVSVGMAHGESRGRAEEQQVSGGVREGAEATADEAGGSWTGSTPGGMADVYEYGRDKNRESISEVGCNGVKRDSSVDGVAYMQCNQEHEEQQGSEETQGGRGTDEPCGCSLADRPRPTNGEWGAADWIRCRDVDKKTGRNVWRPIEPGSAPLAYWVLSRASKISAGIRWLGLGAKTFKAVLGESKAILKAARNSRKEQLAGYGNAIVIPQAVEFIRACMPESDNQCETKMEAKSKITSEDFEGVISAMSAGVDEKNIEIFRRLTEGLDLENFKGPEDFWFLTVYPFRCFVEAYVKQAVGNCRNLAFIAGNYRFVESHFCYVIKKTEGVPCSSDKSRAIISRLFQFYKDGTEVSFDYTGKYTYHFPKKHFRTHAEILAFYEAVEGLFYAQPEEYLAQMVEIFGAVKGGESE